MLHKFAADSTLVKTATNAGADQGPRATFTFGTTAEVSADGYLNVYSSFVGTSSVGIRAHRAGYILGVGIVIDVTTKTSNGVLALQARKNGSSVASATSSTVSATGRAGWGGTFAWGLYSFAVGDILNLYLDLDTFVGAYTGSVAFLEVGYTS